MAITTLPYPSMDFVPLDILTATELDQLVANIEAINNSTIVTSAIADDAVTPAKLDASTYGHFARDNDGGSQTYTASTATTCLLPNQLETEVGCSYSSGIITISQAGRWIITGGVRVASGNDAGTARIKVNGNSVVVSSLTGYASSSASQTGNSTMSWVGHLAVGDTVNLEMQTIVGQTNNTAKQQHMEGMCIHMD